MSNATPASTWTTMSGDATISSGGVVNVQGLNGYPLIANGIPNAFSPNGIFPAGMTGYNNPINLVGASMAYPSSFTTAVITGDGQLASDGGAPVSTYVLTITGTSAGAWKQPVRLATAAALPANTYANGTAGVGATLTGNSNGALSVDGVAVAVGDRILVWQEAAASHNGIYTVTATGGASAVYVLTRATDFNSSITILENSIVIPNFGSTLLNVFFLLYSAGPYTVGTTALNFSTDTTTTQPLAAAPPTSSLTGQLYVLSDGNLYYKDTSGIQTKLTPGGSSSLVFADSLVNAAGTVTLVNDTPSPTAYFVYGANSSGTLGYLNCHGTLPNCNNGQIGT
jgi:hypothetical protein